MLKTLLEVSKLSNIASYLTMASYIFPVRKPYMSIKNLIRVSLQDFYIFARKGPFVLHFARSCKNLVARIHMRDSCKDSCKILQNARQMVLSLQVLQGYSCTIFLTGIIYLNCIYTSWRAIARLIMS